MKILVFSDTHGNLDFMYRCLDAVKPDAVVHLGDHYRDGEYLQDLYPQMLINRVVGNCDYDYPPYARQMLCYSLGGVMTYMTHGHNHHVKMAGTDYLLADARKLGAKLVLYGHTHRIDCRQEPDGVWVLNPGSAGKGTYSAGVVKTDGQNVTACYILTEKDLEDWV